MILNKMIRRFLKIPLVRSVWGALGVFLLFFVIIAYIIFSSYTTWNLVPSQDLANAEDGDGIVLYDIEKVLGDYQYERNTSQYMLVPDNAGTATRLTQTHLQQYITIIGWALIQNENIQNENIQVLLKDKEINTFMGLYTFPIMREDVNKLQQEENFNYNYTACGFQATIKRSKLEIGKKYQIYLWYKNNGHNYLVETNQEIIV